MRRTIPILVLATLAEGSQAQAAIAGEKAEAAVIAGRVFDADRKPVAGAHLVVAALAQPELPPAVVWCLGDAVTRELEAVTDSKGVFRVTLPVASACEIFAWGVDGTFSARVFPAIAGDFLQLRLGVPHHFRGIVTDDSGVPVAGAVVAEDVHLGEQYVREQYGRARHPIRTSTDERGRFDLPALDGGHQIWGGGARTVLATRDGRASALRLYRVDGQDLSDLDLRLVAPEATAAIREAKQGRPTATQPDFALTAIDDHGPCKRRRVIVAMPQTSDVAHVWMTTTDDSGHLAICELQPGQPIESWIEYDDRFVPLLTAVAGTTAKDLGEVRVGHGRTLTGAMRDADGLPLAHARIMLSADHSAFHRIAYCDRGGRYQFEELPDGPAHLVVAAGFAGVAAAEVGADIARFDLQMPTGHTATGTVSLPDGTPARGARLQYIVTPGADEGTRITESVYLFGNSDDEGHFVVRGLPNANGFTMWGMCVQDGIGYMGSVVNGPAANDGIKLTLQVHRGRL